MSKCAWVAGILTWAAAAALSAAAGERAQTVSPGEPGRPAAASRCPTFSWSAVPGAESYDLVVYEFSEERLIAAGEPALMRALPGGARSWTPGRDDCLAAGTSYAWFVRAVGPGLEGEWSKERLFTTEGAIRSEDAAEALLVLQRFLRDGGELEDLVEGEPAGIEAPLEAPSVSERRSPAPPLLVAAEERDDKTVATAWAVPSTRAPLAFTELGLSSLVTGVTEDQNRAAARGAWATEFERASGYLGVDVGDTETGDFDGFPEFKLLSQTEIGVLGIGRGPSTDTYGVVGVSQGGAGGVFYQADYLGQASNLVFLAGIGHAIFTNDAILAGSIEALSCPAGTHEVGAWCIGQEHGASNYIDALKNCWSLDKQLCPLQAILACDIEQPSGADCTAATDSIETKWIWCAELEDATNDDIDGFALVNPNPLLPSPRARVFANNGNHSINEIDFGDKGEMFYSFCCTARP